MRQKIVPIVSILVGLLAFILTLQYLRKEHRRYEDMKRKFYEGATQIEVVVASRDLPRGTILSKEDLRRRRVYQREVQVRGHVIKVEDYELIMGRKTLFKIDKSEALFWSDIEGGAKARGLASLIKPGLRAISLSVAGAAAVSSMIQPNDRVDVLGTFSFPAKAANGEMETVTLTVLQDVTVLATGQTMAHQRFRQDQYWRRSSYNSITLEVTAREAELLVFAQQMKGSLYLSLRNPSDVSFEKDLPEIDFQHLESKLPDLNLYRQRNIRHKRDL